MSSKNMQYVLNLLNSGDISIINNLDEAMKLKLKTTVNFLLENSTSLIPVNNLKQFKNTLDNDLIQEYTLNMDKPSIKLNIDADGNLLITKHEGADLNTIFQNSHILLKEYEKVNNIEGIKYELCKLYMISSIINKKYIHSRSILVSDYKKHDMSKLKSFIMNDFYKYLRIILNSEKTFNFNEYFSNTQFGVETYKIDNNVLKGLKQIIF